MDWLKDIAIAAVVFLVQEYRARQQQRELQDFIAERLAYDNTLFRQLETRGRVKVPRDEGGEPTDIQVIFAEGIPTEEAFGESTVSLGPPPKPPRSVELQGTAQAGGTMSGELTVGRPERSWWRRFFGFE